MVAYATQQAFGRGPVRSQGWSSQEVTAYAEITPVTVTTGDTYDMIRVPSGAIITGVTLSADRLDTNGAPTVALSVGDAASANRYIASSTIGQTAGGGFTNTVAAGTGAMFFKTAAEGNVRVTATVGSATFASGKIRLKLTYLIDPMLS